MGFWAAAAPYIVGAAGSLIGGALSNKNSRDQQAQNQALQREFAQQGIRWKVADAKAAGLHPLYAVGAAGASYTPSTYSDAMGPAVAQAGQYAAQFTQEQQRKRESAMQRNLQRDQIILGQQKLRSDIGVDESQINLNNALAAQALRQPSSGFGDQNVTPESGAVEIVPAEQPSRADSTTDHSNIINELKPNELGHMVASVPPGWELVETSDNRYLLMPKHQGFEQMGEIATLIMTIKENYKFWGKVYYERYGARPSRELFNTIKGSITNAWRSRNQEAGKYAKPQTSKLRPPGRSGRTPPLTSKLR